MINVCFLLSIYIYFKSQTIKNSMIVLKSTKNITNITLTNNSTIIALDVLGSW